MNPCNPVFFEGNFRFSRRLVQFFICSRRHVQSCIYFCVEILLQIYLKEKYVFCNIVDPEQISAMNLVFLLIWVESPLSLFSLQKSIDRTLRRAHLQCLRYSVIHYRITQQMLYRQQIKPRIIMTNTLNSSPS